jgi:hypothetical protein
MSLTSITFRLAFAAGVICGATPSADAKPRRVVILDFDGPRSHADAGRSEVQKILGEQYDVVAKKRWEDARSRAQQKSAGPQTWQKAAKSSGVDAIIEGWVQDEGRHKLLTIAIREAATGQELDTVSVRVGSKGLSDDNRSKLTEELDGVLAYIEGAPEPTGSNLRVIETRKMIGAKAPKVDAPARTEDDVEDDVEDDDAEPRRKKKTRVDASDEETEEEPVKKKSKKEKQVSALDPESTESSDLVSLFGAQSDEGKIADPTAAHVPVPTKRFQISGGAYYGTRSLNVAAEDQAGPTSYSGVPSKGIQLQGAVYPFPTKKYDGGLSGIGFSFAISKSAGSEVTFDDDETVSEYVINQTAYEAGVHYRHPLSSLVSIDGKASYGNSSYLLSDAPQEFEVPDTQYSYVGGAVHLDLTITERAQVGFGAKYMYILDVGDISSTDWYGPGRASGLGLDASFLIPLPQNLFVHGAISYERFKISLDGAGTLTEEYDASATTDATVNGTLDVGIQF